MTSGAIAARRKVGSPEPDVSVRPQAHKLPGNRQQVIAPNRDVWSATPASTHLSLSLTSGVLWLATRQLLAHDAWLPGTGTTRDTDTYSCMHDERRPT